MFFEAIYDSGNGTMQIVFKKNTETSVLPENTEELQVLCKQFCGNLVKFVDVIIKTDNYTLAQFKDYVKNI